MVIQDQPTNTHYELITPIAFMITDFFGESNTTDVFGDARRVPAE